MDKVTFRKSQSVGKTEVGAMWPKKCPQCDGKGSVGDPFGLAATPFDNIVCPRCGGTGIEESRR